MIVMITSTYPSTSAVEISKAVLKNFQEHPFPDFMKPLGIYNVLCESGVKGYAILEIEKGKEDEAFKVINSRYANYLSVPGFGCREERLLPLEDSLPLVGMAAPTT